MIDLVGKLVGTVIGIILFPFYLIIIAIPSAIIKDRNAQKSKLLFTGVEQSLLAKSQDVINMEENGLMSPDKDLLQIARCIENARINYQTIKTKEKFNSSFYEFITPQINECYVSDWNEVYNFFEISSLMASFIDSMPEQNIQLLKLAAPELHRKYPIPAKERADQIATMMKINNILTLYKEGIFMPLMSIEEQKGIIGIIYGMKLSSIDNEDNKVLLKSFLEKMNNIHNDGNRMISAALESDIVAEIEDNLKLLPD